MNSRKDEKTEKMKKELKKKPKKQGCPICGDTENIQVVGRCATCKSCGWSRCSL